MPFDRIWRACSRMLYSLSLTSPRITRYGSFGGIFFQNSARTRRQIVEERWETSACEFTSKV